MKKYFAKYLPIERDIPEWMLKQSEQLAREIRGEDVQHERKVQLFLCSRDIQVGDKVTFFDGVNMRDKLVVESLHEGGGVLKKPTVTVVAPTNQIFKVIAPITPQALWVKEGDEFEEEEIEYWDNSCGKQESSWYHEKLKEGKLEYLTQYFTIKIKCPTCKTFH